MLGSLDGVWPRPAVSLQERHNAPREEGLTNMARRSRENRQEIPGYDESRPSRDERRQRHRATRHATNQALHTFADPEEIVLPEERRSRTDQGANGQVEPARRRFKIWKTKFWKRRAQHQDALAEIDSNWPVITPDQLEEGGTT